MQKEQGKISFVTAVLMGINIMIGAGIFISSKSLVLQSGSLSIFIYPVLAILLFPIVWCVADAARIFPGQGGFYNYSKIGLKSEAAGFMANWLYLLGYLGTAATQATAIRSVILVDQFGFQWIAGHVYLFNLIFVGVFALLNLMSLEAISKIQGFVTILKVLPIIAVILVFGFYWHPDLSFKAHEALGFAAAIPAAAFAFWGFESGTSIGHLVKGGPAKASKVILVAFFIVAIFYSLFYFGATNIMGLQNLATYDIMGLPKFLGLSPSLADGLFLALLSAVLLCMLNGSFGITLFNITNAQSLANENLLFGSKTLIKTNRFGRPFYIVLVHALIVLTLLTFITDLNIYFGFIGLGVVTTLLLTSLSVTITHFKNAAKGKTFLAFLSTIACVALLISSWIALGNDTTTRLIYAAPIMIASILGLVMFKIKKSQQPTK